MTAKRQDITIEQGADFEQDFDLPADIDLTNLQAALQIKADYGYPIALLTLTLQNGGLILNATTRKLKAVIAAGIAAAFYAGKYVYDVKAREASGRITRIHQGMAIVSAEVTTFEFEPVGLPALLYRGGGYLIRHGGGRILLRV